MTAAAMINKRTMYDVNVTFVPTRSDWNELWPTRSQLAVLRNLAAGYGRNPDELQLVVRANIKITEDALGDGRPSYWGCFGQVCDDIDATRATGANEIILDLQSNSRSAAQLLDLAEAVLSPIMASA